MVRKFAILDGMVVVGVIAVGLAGARWHRQSSGMPPAWWGVLALQDSHWIALTSCLAMVPLRFLGPRPARDDLWRQPGWIACLSVSLAIGLGVLQEMLLAP